MLISALKSIWRKRLRSLLTAGTISIGVMSVVIITMIGDVGKQLVNDELESMGVSGVCLRMPAEYGISFDKTALELVEEEQQVLQATPLISKILNIKVRNRQSQSVVWGISGNADKIISMKLLHGRLITKSDINKKQRVCVVDESFALSAYGRSNIVGKTVKIYSKSSYIDYEVVGVVSSGGNLLQGMMGEIVPSFIYIPYTSLTQYFQSSGFSQIVVKTAPEADEAAVAASVSGKLNDSYGISNGIKYENLNQQKEKLNSVLDIVKSVLTIIGGISLAVAGLSIMTVMLMTVSERTREIGIKKSIGASSRKIMLEFLLEAVFLSLIGSGIGAAAGLLLGTIGCGIVGLSPIINPYSIASCIAVSTAVGMAFGAYPAAKAAKLRPVEAIK